MLLNIAPNADGVVPPEAMAIYSAFGQWVSQCYGAPGASSAPPPGAVLELDLSALASVDRIVAMEDQRGGERDDLAVLRVDVEQVGRVRLSRTVADR